MTVLCLWLSLKGGRVKLVVAGLWVLFLFCLFVLCFVCVCVCVCVCVWWLPVEKWRKRKAVGA